MNDPAKRNGKYVFDDAQGMAQQHPDTFEVDSIAELKRIVKPGSIVKVCIKLFHDDWPSAERIWTEVIAVDRHKVTATLANDPFFLKAKWGAKIEFELRHIYCVEQEPE